MFNKILGKKETPQKKSNKKPEDSPSHGFICPVCHLSFENPDILTNHFTTVHQNSDNLNNEDEEKSSLNATAESILKKLNNSQNVTSDTESVQDSKSILSFNETSNQREQALEKEIVQLKEKILSEEEIRTILINDYNERLENSNAALKSLNKEKDDLEQLYKSVLNQLEIMKAENDENRSIRQNLSQIQEEFVNKCEVISKLENELQLRPTQDDLDVLKKELVQVQQLTDVLLKEKENQIKQINRENRELQAKLEKKENEYKCMNEKLESLNEMDSIKVKCSNLEESIKLFEQNEKINQENLKLKEEKIQDQIKEIDNLNVNLKDIKLELESKNSLVTNYLIEIKNLNQEKSELNQNISQLEIKRIELANKLLIAESNAKSSDELSDEQKSQQTEMLSLIKEKENAENELIKVKANHQRLFEEKSEWLNEKNQLLSSIQNTDKEKSNLQNRILTLEFEKSNVELEKNKVVGSLEESERKLKETDERFKIEKSHLESFVKKNEELIKELNRKISELDDEKIRIENQRVKLEQDLENSKNEIQVYKQNKSTVEDSNLALNIQLNQKNLEITELNLRVDTLTKDKENLNTQFKNLNDEFEQLKKSLENELEKSRTTESQKLENDKKLNEIENQNSKLLDELNQLNSQKEELSNEVSSLNQIIQDLNFSLAENHSNNEKKVIELNMSIEKLTLSLSELSQELNQAKENENKLSKELFETKTNFEESFSNESTLKANIKNLELEKYDLLQKVIDKDNLIKQFEEENKTAILEIGNLKNEASSLNNVINDLNSSIDSIKESNEQRINELVQNLAKSNQNLENVSQELNKEKEEKLKISSYLSDSNKKVEQLSQSELNLKSKISEIENDLNNVKSSEQMIRIELEKSNKEICEINIEIDNLKCLNSKLESEKEKISIKLDKITQENEEIKMERDDCDKMRLEAIKKHEIQTKALNQNLASLRTELKLQSDKILQLNSDIDQAKGNNLELEAKLSHFTDERNQLLQQYLEAEKLCEKLKSQNVEYKRKLEDTQAALQELGREHQTLQVLNHRKSNYKWVDDSLVNDCTQCKKAFSVTNRKHHCRNCGQVFCNECSDYTAQVSSSKKPQRVCKACHIELNE